MLFKGRNEVPYSYSEFGYTRGNGTVWHGGIDIVGVDDDTILMPSYMGKSITGIVRTSGFVPQSTGDRTWEWGNYVCVQLNYNETPDTVNYLYFCHNKQNLVKVGQTVKTGDAIAIMGNTGNAAQASPPIPHVHFEVRAAKTSAGVNPTAYTMTKNAQGVYGTALVSSTSGVSDNADKSYTATIKIDSLRLRTLPDTESTTIVLTLLEKGQTFDLLQTKNGWAYLKTSETSGGWACMEQNGTSYIDVEEKLLL